MKAIILVLIALCCGVEAAHPNALVQMFQQVYPGDAEQSKALDLCFMSDHQFNRLDPAARDACYRRFAVASGQAVTRPAPTAQANFVDLWRASGQGRLPQNDIRFQQQNDRFLHPYSAGNGRDAPPLAARHRAPAAHPAIARPHHHAPPANVSAAYRQHHAWPAIVHHRV